MGGTSRRSSLILSRDSFTRMKQSSGRNTSSMYSEIWTEQEETVASLQHFNMFTHDDLWTKWCIKYACGWNTSPRSVFSILPFTSRAKSASSSTSKWAVIIGVLSGEERTKLGMCIHYCDTEMMLLPRTAYSAKCPNSVSKPFSFHFHFNLYFEQIKK